MSYEQVCAFSKKAISEGAKVRVLFLTAEPYSYISNEKGFFSEPSFVYPWSNFKILGFPLEGNISNTNIREFEFKNKKEVEMITDYINAFTNKENSINEIIEKAFHKELLADNKGNNFPITYMVILEDVFQWIINQTKMLSYRDEEFFENQYFSRADVFYKDSLNNKVQYFKNAFNITEDVLLNQEKEKYIKFTKSLSNDNQCFKDTQLNLIYFKRYNTSYEQTPWVFKFKHFIKNYDISYSEILGTGLCNNVWISEIFEKYRIPFMPTMNTIEEQHNELQIEYFKEMIKILKK